MPVTPPASGSFSAVALLGGLLSLLAVGAIAGLVLVADVLDEPADAAQTPRAWSTGDDVPTSFGFVAVEHAEVLKGLTPRQLGGATHGIAGFVGRDKALVQASVTITNTSGDVIDYTPEQFSLVSTRTGKRRARVSRVPLSHATVRPGRLQPDAAIDARVSFVVPRDGADLEVEFADPARTDPIRIAIGDRAGRISAADRRALAESHDHSKED